GQLADRLSRRRLAAGALAVSVVVVSLLFVVTVHGARQVWPFLGLASGAGVASAIGWPAFTALVPELVPAELLPGAVALRSVASQMAVVTGPALGGLLFALRPELVYGVAVTLYALALVAMLTLKRRESIRELAVEGPPGLASLVAGVRFVLRTRMLLGAIALDLFAVLFGGAAALLPVFARSILHTGPVGLGVLRSAPAVGALTAALILTRRPLRPRAGPTLLVVVGTFGVCMVVFGLSRSIPLSLGALAVAGFVDMISVNIRATTVALVTPNELRGRVNAVEMVFISASNELGAFESGLVASLVGTVTCVVAGGIATIAIALSWTGLFPSLARMGRLEDLRPEPAAK
ncbi:MAG TPA: MFS transporter, partial [Gaiellaceae bacterium]